jgi:hypothetical protein
LLDGRIRAAVDHELAAKGYQAAAPAKAGFLVGYHVVVKERVDAATLGGWYGHGGWWGPGQPVQPVVRRYEEGTLILDVIDPATDRLLWRGTGTAVVDPDASPKAKERRINTVVAKVLERFPPK